MEHFADKSGQCWPFSKMQYWPCSITHLDMKGYDASYIFIVESIIHDNTNLKFNVLFSR